MNRLQLILAILMTAVLTGYAVTIDNKELTGDEGEAGTNIVNELSLTIEDSILTGGVPETNRTGSSFWLNGNAGITISTPAFTNVTEIQLIESEFAGSDAGNTTGAGIPNKQAIGGHGMDLRGDFIFLNSLGDGMKFTGGDGGIVRGSASLPDDNSRAYGGDGLFINTLESGNQFDLTITAGSYTGGKGGTAAYNSDAKIDPNAPAFGESQNYLGEYFGVVGGPLGARGGHGLRIFNEDFGQYGSTLTIVGGNFTGGAGGTVTNFSTAGGSANADGGHGIFTDYIDVTITGGSFTGGAAGTVNTNKGTAGYGVKVRDGNLLINATNSLFSGNGLWFESHYYDSTADIKAGKFGKAVIASRYDEFAKDPNRTTTSTISGGTFNNLTFMGAGAGKSINNATLTGGTIGVLNFMGSRTTSEINISLTTNVVVSTNVLQQGGTVNVSQWADDHFADTTISSGTMNFNGRAFNLDGGSFTLALDINAKVNFNNGLVTTNETSVNVGKGTIYAPTVTLGDNTHITSTIVRENDVADKKNGQVGLITTGTTGTNGILTVDSGVKWTVDTLNRVVEHDTAFILAQAYTINTNNFSAANMDIIGSKVIKGWLGSIDEVEVTSTRRLVATYRLADIDKALGVQGETSTEYGKAVADFTKLNPATSNPDSAYADLASLAATAEEAGVLMSNSYVRATEMAHSLVGLQTIFSQQIRDRTRSRLRHQGVGYPEAATPAGSAGWDAMRQFSDRMEDRFGYDEIKSAVDSIIPDVKTENVMESADKALPHPELEGLTLPKIYRTWGRGYGSFNEQKTADGFVGYDAIVGGGIVGIDRQIDNILLGVAGGYARTTVEGYAGKDGVSDTGHATAYFSAHGKHAFLDANATYAYNGVETEYNMLGYKGSYAAHTAGFYLGGGYAFSISENLLLTPEASILSALYTREAYTESSALYPDLMWDSYDQWSHLGTIGGTLTMIQYIDLQDSDVAIQPEVRLHYLHEFNNEFDDETYQMVGGDYTIGASLKAREEDLIRVGAGVRMSSWAHENTEFGVDVDGTFGDNYNAYIVSGKFIHRF